MSLDPRGAKVVSPAGFRFPLSSLSCAGIGWGTFRERMEGFALATHDVSSRLARPQSSSHFLGV